MKNKSKRIQELEEELCKVTRERDELLRIATKLEGRLEYYSNKFNNMSDECKVGYNCRYCAHAHVVSYTRINGDIEKVYICDYTNRCPNFILADRFKMEVKKKNDQI